MSNRPEDAQYGTITLQHLNRIVDRLSTETPLHYLRQRSALHDNQHEEGIPAWPVPPEQLLMGNAEYYIEPEESQDIIPNITEDVINERYYPKHATHMKELVESSKERLKLALETYLDSSKVSASTATEEDQHLSHGKEINTELVLQLNLQMLSTVLDMVACAQEPLDYRSWGQHRLSLVQPIEILQAAKAAGIPAAYVPIRLLMHQLKILFRVVDSVQRRLEAIYSQPMAEDIEAQHVERAKRPKIKSLPINHGLDQELAQMERNVFYKDSPDWFKEVQSKGEDQARFVDDVNKAFFEQRLKHGKPNMFYSPFLLSPEHEKDQ
ncbi:hypothetical protein EC973_008800 [Apophysomyces ossiformis]|uniref:Uncharacterized protein n=1 Tax=Apophysomyces ossiformis TaxID=679940 RepID=A0A8H7BZ17_9FUNG|nr:hypothetical protein EC973_008800 [Apophysomyces ossiformis]